MLNTPLAHSSEASDYKEYAAYFEKVYQQFENHYYLAPSQKIYKDFLQNFRGKIYDQLKKEKKSNDYVRWRAAWYLVDALKSPEDKFSQFYPPKPAQEFQKEAMGQRVDLGIEGKKVDAGFMVTMVEPRSDAYEQGLREQDIILRIDGKDVKERPQEEIEKSLSPLIHTHVPIVYFARTAKIQKTISVISKEYYKLGAFLRPVAVPGVFCIELAKFNRTTGDDIFRYLLMIMPYNPLGLVLDLRGNPGGPPLAAREISSIFLKSGEEFAYFQKRNTPKDSLDVPPIPEQYKFKAPIAILVDENSGSASELFAGIMQFRHRAVVFGANTAGQVLLKTMFPMDDGAMIALVTAVGYYPDGTRFSFQGITPDKIIHDAPKEGLINFAAAFLLMKDRK